MGSFLAKGSFLLCLIFLNIAVANAEENEARRLLDEVQANELALMATVGLETSQFRADTQGFEYARAVHADSFVETLKNDPGLMLDQNLLSDWFNLEISAKPEYKLPLKDLMGLTLLQFNDRDTGLDHMEKNGFFRYLSNFELNPADPRVFANEQSQTWLNEMIQTFESKEAQDRNKVWEFLRLYRSPKIEGYTKKYFFENVTEKILSSLTNEAKLRFMQETLSQKETLGANKMALPYNLVVQWALNSIPFKKWKQNHLELLAKVLRSMDSVTGTFVVVQWLVANPSLAKEYVPVLKTSTPGDLARGDGEGLTLLEQLLNFSHEYRSVFYQSITNDKINSWTMSVIQFAFEEGAHYPRTADINRTLTFSYVLQNPNWFEWLNQLSSLERRPLLNYLVGFNALYSSSSEQAQVLQKNIFDDIRSGLVTGRVPTRNLAFFMERALKNPQLLEVIVSQWTADLLALGNQEVTTLVVDLVFNQSEVEFERKIHWLGIILENELSNSDLITKLVNVFGVDAAFRMEMERVGDNQELLAEVARMALTEHLFASGGASCQKLF